MDLKLGDFVRFVDENLEGYITRIIDKDTIGVTDANDFEIPVLASKVTLVHGDVPSADDSLETKQAPQSTADFIKKGIHLAVIADQHNSAVAHFHLINQSSYQLVVSFTTENNGDFKGEFAGIIAPVSNKKIYSAQLSNIQLWPKFRIEILFNTQLNIEPQEPIIHHQQLKGKDLSVAKQEIPLLSQKGWLIPLEKEEPLIDAEKLRESFFTKK